MPRHYNDWLTGFLDYSSVLEAPRHFYFWAGVSAVAGALRRKVWIDQAYYKWYPNFYIVLVGPPAVVSKSTTAGVSMNLLKQVPGIHFGPDVVTWPALVTAFAEITEEFEWEGAYYPMSAMTLEASEFGNLLNPQDREMVDLFVSLWDGKQGPFKKSTKTSGKDEIQNPWINLIACTTPSWIRGSFPEYMIGGGFTSRALFVYADKKAKRVSYPGSVVPRDIKEVEGRLVEDLTEISKLAGEYKLSPEAFAYGKHWYDELAETELTHMDQDRFGGYAARKQSHMHKLAMVLAAASSDRLVIELDHLKTAHQMVADLEPDMNFVFSKVGRSDVSLYIEKLVAVVHQRGRIAYPDAYRTVHGFFPSMRDFEDALAGCVRAGYVKMEQEGGVMMLVAGVEMESATNGNGG